MTASTQAGLALVSLLEGPGAALDPPDLGCPVRWFAPADVASAPGISEDSRLLAVELLALAAPQPGPQFRWLPTGRVVQSLTSSA